MSSSNIDPEGKYNNDCDDSKSVDSFESALCAMYNDVLCHAVIPEEEEVIHLGRRGKGRPPVIPRNLTHPSRQDSFASFRSASTHSAMSTSSNSMMLASSNMGKDGSLGSPRKEITHVSQSDSCISFRSAFSPSMGSASSCMLSVDSETDDDVSYITEPDFEESRRILLDQKISNRLTNGRSSPMKNIFHERYIFGCEKKGLDDEV